MRRIRPRIHVLCATAGAAVAALAVAAFTAQPALAAGPATALCTGPQPDGTALQGQVATCLITPTLGLNAGDALRITAPGTAITACSQSYNDVSVARITNNQCQYTVVNAAPVYSFGPLMLSIPPSARIGEALRLQAAACSSSSCATAAPLIVIGPAARVGVVSASSIAGLAGSAPAVLLCTGTGPRGSTVAGQNVTCSVSATQAMSDGSNMSVAPLGNLNLARVSCDPVAPGVTTVLPTARFAGPACTVRLNGASAGAFTVLATVTYTIPGDTPTGTVLAFSGFICEPPGCGGPIPELAVGGPGLVVGVVPALPVSTSGQGPAGVNANGTGTAGSAVSPDEAGPTPVMSTLASSIATPAQAFVSMGHTLVSVAIAAALVLFITFPAALFNKTLEENYDDIRDSWERRFGWMRRIRERVRREGGHGRLIAFILVLLAGAVLAGFLDPHFGFNRSSAISFGAVVLAILFGMSVPAVVNRAYRRTRGADGHLVLHALPAGLMVGALCVIVSRLTQFQPGYLYGVIVGVVFTGTLGRKEQGQALALAALSTVFVAVIAWLLWLPAHAAASGASASSLLILASDFLGAVFTAGLVGAALSMLPFRFLPGGALMAWNRAAWAATFGLALFGVVEILLRPGTAHTSNAPLVVTLVLFVLSGSASVAFALYFSRRRRRRLVAAAPG